jgi:hypothetical protein
VIVVIQNGFVIVMQNGFVIVFLPPEKILTIGATMNKLDSFNKDKIKCKKCKDYYDESGFRLCGACLEKWLFGANRRRDSTITFDDWCNNEQT